MTDDRDDACVPRPEGAARAAEDGASEATTGASEGTGEGLADDTGPAATSGPVDGRDAARRRILSLVADGMLTPGDAAEQLAALENDEPHTATTRRGERTVRTERRDPPWADAETIADATQVARAAADALREVAMRRMGGRGPTRRGGSEPRQGSRPVRGEGRKQPARPAPSEVHSDARPGRLAGNGPVKRIRIQSAARSVIVTADDEVREAVADGRHQASYEGDALVIRGEPDVESDLRAFAFTRHGSRRVSANTRQGIETLHVRMNPNLDLDAEIAAGTLSVSGVRGRVKAHVAAGSLKLVDFRSPIDVEVAAGSFKGSGRLDHGESRISCAMGSVKLDLQEGSSVHITADSALGSVKLPGGAQTSDNVRGKLMRLGVTEGIEATVGRGDATLKVEANMGSVKIVLDGDDALVER